MKDERWKMKETRRHETMRHCLNYGQNRHSSNRHGEYVDDQKVNRKALWPASNQDIVACLGWNPWFSLLNQGKASGYHCDYLESIRPSSIQPDGSSSRFPALHERLFGGAYRCDLYPVFGRRPGAQWRHFKGIGATMYQEQHGKLRVIAYAFRTIT